MSALLAALGIISVTELLLWPALWRARKLIAPLLAAALAAASLLLVVIRPSLWTVVLAVTGAYRCLNLARVTYGRMQPDHLYDSTRKTGYWLIGSQAPIAMAAWADNRYGFGDDMWWMLAADIMLVSAAALFAATSRHLRTTRPPKPTRTFTDAELPALTVAIPARNETDDLERCLRSLLTSTYPKLEIIVLDDCSQNKRTPEIIRSFAHEGIRFIAGEEPPAGWLAKNYAYEQLAKAANGDLLLFCGVDVRFEPGSLDALVRIMLQKHRAMISILPRDEEPRTRSLPPWFMQPNRYAWELSLPRRLMKRPPVLSTCWLITREALEAAGGFDAVRRKGVPESYFARTAATEAGYSFLQADPDIGISSRKTPDEQRATAIRTRYLQLHRRPEMTALISFSELGVLVLPPILAVVSLITGQWFTAALAGTAFILNCVVYSRVFNLAYRRSRLKGIWLLPVAASYDIGLLNYSMWKYEFSEVIWKGRNVCIPLMRIVPGSRAEAAQANQGSARRR